MFEESQIHELRDGFCNFWGPLPNAGVEHPPMKDAVDSVLGVRMPGQIVKDFRCRRRELGVGEHTLGRLNAPLATAVPLIFGCSANEPIPPHHSRAHFRFSL